ncbi:MAG: ATP synthase F1 subunit gamma [Sedimentisphaerales bacterium]|nr:ATP synthase F1 subunit gamma [Sedimentisphaerales bacterium]MBN2841494.1 ATP synthase F1 subunit gamma [Sedimentisphaerales bacterium]
MANTREILQRKNTISNICKITRTMEMVATSRFKKAHDKSVGLRCYTDNITYLVNSLAGGKEARAISPLLQRNSSKKVVQLVFSSNRGLCGSYNSSLLRLAERNYDNLRASGHTPELRVIGKKGVSYFNFIKKAPKVSYTHINEKTTYGEIEKIANELISLYESGMIGGVDIVYTCFDSSSIFYPKKVQLLPFESSESRLEREKKTMPVENYIFLPAAEDILKKLLPAAVRTRLYQCFCDSIASEQMSRMRSMKAATDNAQEMITELASQYNKARQGQITGELLDIVGGAEALK